MTERNEIFSNLDYENILDSKVKNLVHVVNIKFGDKARIETFPMTVSIERRAFVQFIEDPERNKVVGWEP